MQKLKLIKLKNKKGTQLEVLNFGATIFKLVIDGVNVVVGPARPEDYLSEVYHRRGKHFGASIGRHAGRISGGGFRINGGEFPLFEEDGIHIHGGKKGFTYKFWKVKEVNEQPDPFVILEYFSPDGEEGYPGNLEVQVKYTLTEADEVKIEYTAKTDKETVVNLTNHTYFNLNGRGSINGHQLKIQASHILETNDQNVPTGKFLPVEDHDKDFRSQKRLASVFLDTVFKLDQNQDQVVLSGDESGIELRVSTNQPAVVVYVPEVLPGDWEYGTAIGATRAAICLEAQKFPDAPHHPHFPPVLLKSDESYNNSTIWSFSSRS